MEEGGRGGGQSDGLLEGLCPYLQALEMDEEGHESRNKRYNLKLGKDKKTGTLILNQSLILLGLS
jgi:hypothetical protein